MRTNRTKAEEHFRGTKKAPPPRPLGLHQSGQKLRQERPGNPKAASSMEAVSSHQPVPRPPVTGRFHSKLKSREAHVTSRLGGYIPKAERAGRMQKGHLKI